MIEVSCVICFKKKLRNIVKGEESGKPRREMFGRREFEGKEGSLVRE